MARSDLIAVRFVPDVLGFMKRFRWKNALSDFIDAPHSETYHHGQYADGAGRLERTMNVEVIGKWNPSDVCVRVTTAAIDCELSYAGVLDEEGVDFDLVIAGTWKISDRRAFLLEYALDCLKSAGDISVTSLETMLTERCRQWMTDEARKLTYEALKKRDALPIRWWSAKLPQWIGLDWLELVEVKGVHCESVSLDRAAEIRKRQKLTELEEAEKTAQQERELREKERQAEYDHTVREIEAAKECSKRERQMRLDELNRKHEHDTLDAKYQAEIAALEAEKRKAELQAEIEQLRNRADSAEEILRRAKETEERNKETLKAIQEAQSEMAELASFVKEAMQKGEAVTDRMNTSVSGMSSETMGLLGRARGPAYLASVFRDKAAASPRPVKVSKVELRTRDIGPKKVDTLAINTPLRFQFLANRSGYATVLNIGTSGKVWLHVPSAYVSTAQAKVQPGNSYQVPGPELLPDERLRQNNLAYLEIGPPGWEELIVIISNEPLVTEKDLLPSTAGSPFAVLPTDRIDELLEQLATLPDDAWDVGILSFLVE